MPGTGLGKAFAGTLVSDFYSVYTSSEDQHQFCWAHLPREVDEMADRHRQHPVVGGRAVALHQRYQRRHAAINAYLAARRQAQHRLTAEALALGAPHVGVAEAPQPALCERIERYLAELFVFVADSTVPATNNAAERSLRRLVTCHKISGSTRGAEGTTSKMALATLFGACTGSILSTSTATSSRALQTD